MHKLIPILLASLVAGVSGSVTAGTLETVKQRGKLNCGISNTVSGFAMTDDSGNWIGLNIDLCRAVAAAVFKDASKVSYHQFLPSEAISKLQEGNVDMLASHSVWTQSRDASSKLGFAGISFFDQQGFLVSTSSGLSSATELDGSLICYANEPAIEWNLNDYFRANSTRHTAVRSDTWAGAVEAFLAGRCDVITGGSAILSALHSELDQPKNYFQLPETISKYATGPIVNQADGIWFDIVHWSLLAMIEAEYLGITRTNVDAKKSDTSPQIKRFLGVEGNTGKHFGLSADWAYQIVKHVGNYGESFEKYVGQQTSIGLARGYNEQWYKGGLLYSAPVR